MIQSQNLCVNVKQEFLNLFQNSQAVSLSKGKSHFLARLSKKSKNQSKLDEYEEEKRINDDKIIRLEKEIDRLKDKCQALIEADKNNDINAEKLDKLYQFGLIDEDGNLIENDMN